MASVAFQKIEKSFGRVKIIHGISFDISDGEFVVLVGPSGCGKSTLLRMVAGLEDISAGEISIDGRVINELDSKDRDIAMVFQSYALYPHMTVRDNMAFSLKLRRADAALTSQRVGDAARILNLELLLDRFPRELSGGQRQRVGVARALAADPPVILLDEPFGALDPITRRDIQQEFKSLQQELGKTMVFVTHDIAEAFVLGSRIGLLKDGEMVLLGVPAELLESSHPEARAFAACFHDGQAIGRPA